LTLLYVLVDLYKGCRYAIALNTGHMLLLPSMHINGSFRTRTFWTESQGAWTISKTFHSLVVLYRAVLLSLCVVVVVVWLVVVVVCCSFVLLVGTLLVGTLGSEERVCHTDKLSWSFI
jgi:hypothetical protein